MYSQWRNKNDIPNFGWKILWREIAWETWDTHRLKDSIKMDHKEIGWGDVIWFKVTQGTIQLWAIVMFVLNFYTL